MGLTVTEDTPADMLAGNMELLVQLPPRNDDEDYDNDDTYDEDDHDHERHQHLRNNHRHHNNHHNNNANGHHQRRNGNNGNARRVTVARNTPMMDLLVQVATSQKLSASSYTLEAIGEHGLVLTHHPNTPIGALDALQVKLLPKQGTFVPMKTRHANQPFETTFRLQVHLPRNQLYVSRVSSRMNLGKILDEVCREKNLDRNNYELRHPANIEETLDLSLSLQDYHLQEVTLCPKRRSMGSSLSSQDIMALQRQEERRRQEAKQSVFGFAFKKSKDSSLSTDSLGERSVSPARSDGTGRSASPQAPPTAPTRPQRKRRPAPKPPMIIQASQEINATAVHSNDEKNIDIKDIEREEKIIISHSRNSSDSSGYHEASVLSDNLDSNIRVPETLPRRSKLQTSIPQELNGRSLAESSQASKSLGNLAVVVVPTPRTTISRGISNSSLTSAGLRKKKTAAPPPPQTRPLSSAISTQALERIVDSEESLTSSVDETIDDKASSDLVVSAKRKSILSERVLGSDVKPKNDFVIVDEKNNVEIKKEEEEDDEKSDYSTGIKSFEFVKTTADIKSSSRNENNVIPNVETASEHKHKRAVGVAAPVPKPRGAVVNSKFENVDPSSAPPKTQISLPKPRKDLVKNDPILSNLNNVEGISKIINQSTKKIVDEGRLNDQPHSLTVSNKTSAKLSPKPIPRSKTNHVNNVTEVFDNIEKSEINRDLSKVPKKPRRKTLENSEITEIITNEHDFERRIEGDEGIVEVVFDKNDESMKQEGNNVRKVMKLKEMFKQEANFGKKINSNGLIETENKHNNSGMISSGKINDGKRSCAIISTVPKCDHFEGPISNRTIMTSVCDKDRKRSDDDGSQYSLNSSLGSSFGAGKSIFNNNLKSSGTPSLTTDVTNSEDELELENFEMFEQSRKILNVSNLVRSHSELNNFEINTFEGNGRHLTSRSADFTFALNPHLSRNISDSPTDNSYADKCYAKKQSKNCSVKKLLINNVRTPSTKLPDFLTNNITWERPELLREAEEVSSARRGTSSTFGESDLVEEGRSITEEVESTSDLLKKVSDTLSGSLRSPKTETGITSSLANEDQCPRLLRETSNAECVEQKETPKDIRIVVAEGINDAKRFSSVDDDDNNLGNNVECINAVKESSNFLNDSRQTKITKQNDEVREEEEVKKGKGKDKYKTASILSSMQNNSLEDSSSSSSSSLNHLSSTTNDWEYILPEPPTAFRDTEIKIVKQNNEVFSSSLSEKKTAQTNDEGELRKSKTNSNARINETLKSNKNETFLNSNINSSNSNEENIRSRNSSISFSENCQNDQSSTIERKLAARSFTKSNVDTDSRRGSQASSTPSVAPVDNTLSNFVITTYSRPKNVDIFDEIDKKSRETTQVILNRNNSTQNLNRPSVCSSSSDLESRKSSTNSLNKDHLQPRIFVEEKSVDAVTVSHDGMKKNNKHLESQSRIADEPIDNNKDFYSNVSRSNIKISIATKPRPKSEIIFRDNVQKSKSIIVNNVKNEDVKTVEDTVFKESPHGGNQKFSQWREDILKKQETPTKEKQLQSLQVLRSILPQLEGTRRDSEESFVKENKNSNPSEETRVEATISNNDSIPTEPNFRQSLPKASSSDEQRVKRYTYAGPPAIDLGSWSDRSRTTKVQIKPDKDYKFEKTVRTPEAQFSNEENSTILNSNNNHNNTVNNNKSVAKVGTTTTVTLNSVKPEHPTFSTTTIKNQSRIISQAKIEKQPNELAKTLIARTTASGFKKLESSGSAITTLRSTNDDIRATKSNVEILKERKEEEEEVDVRPRNFKELKEAFAKEENTNNSLTIPKYGTFGRRNISVTENSTTNNNNNNYKSTTTIVRRDSNVTLNGATNHVHEENISSRKEAQNYNGENSVRIINKPIVSTVQDNKRNFVTPSATISNNNRRCNGYQDVVGTAVRRTSQGNLMPVVKGFKINVKEDDQTHSAAASHLPQEKKGGFRVAIGDISNGNFIPGQNTLRKTAGAGQVKIVGADCTDNGIPKPPPTMPVITGVTLKSTNPKNSRPKSMPASEPDNRNLLLESIRNFGTENQLKSIPRRNTNIAGAPGSRSVRS